MKEITAITALEGRISTEHFGVIEGAKASMTHAIKAGEYLEDAKKILPHGKFIEWITGNLPITERTAQNYMRVYAKKAQLLAADVPDLSSAYELLTERQPPRDVSDAPVPPVYEQNPEEEVLVADVQPTQKDNHSVHWYWGELKRIIDKMDSGYEKMRRQRNAKTPKGLAYLIGNVKLMANRLRTWEPESLMECTECDGTGKVMVTPQKKNGTPIETACEKCINGKTGFYVEQDE